MEHPRHQFFARSAFPLNQDGAVAVGDFLHKIQYLLHRFADADQLLQAVLLAHGFPEKLIFLAESLKLDRFFHHHHDGIGIERLRHKIEGAGFHRLDRTLNGPESCHDDRNDFRVDPRHSLNDFEPVKIRQLEVCHQNLNGILFDDLHARRGIGGDRDGIPFRRQRLLQDVTHGLVVIND